LLQTSRLQLKRPAVIIQNSDTTIRNTLVCRVCSAIDAKTTRRDQRCQENQNMRLVLVATPKSSAVQAVQSAPFVTRTRRRELSRFFQGYEAST
jgi:hypothetical protein